MVTIVTVLTVQRGVCLNQTFIRSFDAGGFRAVRSRTDSGIPKAGAGYTDIVLGTEFVIVAEGSFLLVDRHAFASQWLTIRVADALQAGIVTRCCTAFFSDAETVSVQAFVT